MSTLPKPHLLGLLAGLFMASGLVVSTTLLTRTWLKVADAESITVTGSSRRNVSSDLVVWRGSLTVESPTLMAAQALLSQQESVTRGFLTTQGVSASKSAAPSNPAKRRAKQKTPRPASASAEPSRCVRATSTRC